MNNKLRSNFDRSGIVLLTKGIVFSKQTPFSADNSHCFLQMIAAVKKSCHFLKITLYFFRQNHRCFQTKNLILSLLIFANTLLFPQKSNFFLAKTVMIIRRKHWQLSVENRGSFLEKTMTAIMVIWRNLLLLSGDSCLWPHLLTWINFNRNMDW